VKPDTSNGGSAQNCPINWIVVNNECQCPATTTATNGTCVDQSGTVSVGGEFLRSGFPLQIDLYGGTYLDPVYIKIANIDTDAQPELIFKAGNSPIWMWKGDGSAVSGWPTDGSSTNNGKLVLAEFNKGFALNLMIAHESWPGHPGYFDAFESDASFLPGWPIGLFYSTIAPVAADLDSDGSDEVIYEDGPAILAINSAGQTVGNYPNPDNAQSWSGISAADLNGDGKKEIIAITNSTTDFTQQYNPYVRYLYVFNADFTVLTGFPLKFIATYNFQPVIGDLDGDGLKEIVIATGASHDEYAASGTLSHVMTVTAGGQIQMQKSFANFFGNNNYINFVLEDLDGDGTPEVFFNTGLDIQAIRGDGTSLPGWPVRAAGEPFIVGDIDGDGERELTTWHMYGSPFSNESKGILDIYDKQGSRKNINITIDYLGAGVGIMPAIADLDHNGRNQLIIVGNFLNTFTGYYPQVWAFDFSGQHYAKSGWNQMFGNAKNTGEYNSLE
jgi:hypothetical protein